MPKQPRCRTCNAPVIWFLSPFTGNRRTFDPRPVNGRTHQGPPAYPVDGGRAWKVLDLVDDLVVRRETSEAAARDEAYDMPWHLIHECPTTTPTEQEHTR